MNHVQILHSGEVQNLHSAEVHFFPPGGQNANFSSPRGGKYFPQASRQKLPPGKPDCNLCTHARMQNLHSGRKRRIPFAYSYNDPFRFVY